MEGLVGLQIKGGMIILSASTRERFWYFHQSLKPVGSRGVTIPSCHDSIHMTILNSQYNIIVILQNIIKG